MAEAGLEPLHVSMEVPSTFIYGAELLAEMMGRWPTMTGLFAGNDNLALGALFECQRRGIRVPEDLSIVGFNDLEFSAVAFPSLTTVATPRYRIGERAAKIVLEIIRGSGARPPEPCIDLGFQLIRRGSTQPPRETEIR
jgi:LacI family gluconate utilization system Gnt-I transcriptional repressor